MGKKPKRPNLRPARVCAFCGNGGLTKEHVWADWMRPYLPRVFARTDHTASRSALSLLGHGPNYHKKGPGYLHRPGDPHSQRLKVVCGDCNSGWMSRLQEKTKPILAPLIQDQWQPLSREDQKTLAAWLTMFTMVFEFADPNTQATPFEQRNEFRLTQVPPNGWSAWIGRFDGRLWRGVVNHFGWRSAPFVVVGEVSPTVLLTANLDTQSTAIAPGRIFLMSFSTARHGLKVEERTFAGRFGLRVLWPNPDDAVVGPDHVLDDVAADNVSAALQPMPRNTIRRAWET